ncbi:hypothetical protein EMIT0158MI4_60146 [Burkholderia ambifaria]
MGATNSRVTRGLERRSTGGPPLGSDPGAAFHTILQIPRDAATVAYLNTPPKRTGRTPAEAEVRPAMPVEPARGCGVSRAADAVR